MIEEGEKLNYEDNDWRRWKVEQSKKLKKVANDMAQKELL